MIPFDLSRREHSGDPGGHVADLLPDYLNGRLAMLTEQRVRAHLAHCEACAAELRAWEGIAGAERFAAADAAAPSLAILDRIWAEIDEAPLSVASVMNAHTAQPVSARLAHFWQTLAAQRRLLRRSVWIASALAIFLAVLYAATLPRYTGESDVLAVALPLIAAAGVAFLYGPENDAGLELALATPTSARAVVLSRFALLFGYDVALALGGTLLLAGLRGESFWTLATVWLGPMALLAALSLALSLALGPLIALGGAAVFWLARVIQFDHGITMNIVPGMLWQTTPQILLVALALLLLALLYAPRQERLRTSF